MALVSIITINLNNRKGLEKTVESVIHQSFVDFEYVVVDGGSSDGSAEYLKEKTSRIHRWVSEKDSGIYSAMNKGISMSAGEYLLFLNSGDEFISRGCLEEFLAKKPIADIIAGDLVLDVGGRDILATNPDQVNALHLYESTILHPCTLIRKTLLEQTGLYDETFKITADYAFFLKALLYLNASYEHRQMVLARFDTSGISSDAAFKEVLAQERQRALQQYFNPLSLEAIKELYEIKRSNAYRIWNWILKHFK